MAKKLTWNTLRRGEDKSLDTTMTFREEIRKVRVQEYMKLDMADMEAGRGFKQLSMSDLQQVNFSYKHMLYVLGLSRHPEKGNSSILSALDDDVFKSIIQIAYPEHFSCSWPLRGCRTDTTTRQAPLIIQSHPGGSNMGNGSANAKDAFAYALIPCGQYVMPYATTKTFIRNIHTILHESGALMYDCDDLIQHTLNLPNIIIFPQRNTWLDGLRAYDQHIAKKPLQVADNDTLDQTYSERVSRMLLEGGYCAAPPYVATHDQTQDLQEVQAFYDEIAYNKFFGKNFKERKFYKILLFDAKSWNSNGFRNFMKDCSRCTPRNCVDRMIKALHYMDPSWFKIYPYNIQSRYRPDWNKGFKSWIDSSNGDRSIQRVRALASYEANLIGMDRKNLPSTY